MRRIILALVLVLLSTGGAAAQTPREKHYLYVVVPGIRNYLEFGGAGILVYDMDNGHKLLKRIRTPASAQAKPKNIKGVCASPVTGRLYFTDLTDLYCVDLRTEKTLWQKALPDGCDRMSITPDGKILYVPSLEKDHWNVVNAESGEVITRIRTDNRAHNTVGALDGSRMYLGGIKLPTLFVADAKTHEVVKKVGTFGGGIRPFTVNAAQTRAYVNVNELLGFEVADLQTGKLLHRVQVEGFKEGDVKRHGCPSHGVGLTPDETEVWCCDAANQQMHIFDNTVSPPRQVASVKVREQPGWITFSLDGRYAYPSTGEVIDTKTRRIVDTLSDEEGHEVHSEKIVEVVFADGTVIRVGDQFGLGRKGK